MLDCLAQLSPLQASESTFPATQKQTFIFPASPGDQRTVGHDGADDQKLQQER